MIGHEFADVVCGHGTYRLRCQCGWSAPEGGSAQGVATSWDEHLAAVAADDDRCITG